MGNSQEVLVHPSCLPSHLFQEPQQVQEQHLQMGFLGAQAVLEDLGDLGVPDCTNHGELC